MKNNLAAVCLDRELWRRTAPFLSSCSSVSPLGGLKNNSGELWSEPSWLQIEFSVDTGP